MSQGFNFIVVGMHHMRKPDVVAGPSEALQIGNRALTKLLLAEAIFVGSFRQMGVQIDLVVSARQFRRFFH